MSLTRRNFLQFVGAAAGAEAVHLTMQALDLAGAGAADAAPPRLPGGSGKGTSVVILGAGISGLAAAHELSKAGYRCTILEATDRAGGRNRTVRAGDTIEEFGGRQRVDFEEADHLYANLGPARIPYHHRAILGYCKEFGVELEVFTNDNRAALFHDRERFGGKPVTARQVITDTRGYVAELLAKAVGQGALDSELSGEDKERILEMLVSYGGLKPDRLYKGSNRGGYRGAHIHAGLKAGEVNAPLDLSEILQADFWRYKLHFSHFLNQNPTLFQPVGGMDAIAKGFEKRVGRLIRYRSIVKEIRQTAGGVRVLTGQGAVEADFAVCTIPAPVLKDIPGDFSPRTRAAIASIGFVPAVKIAFQARRRFWEEDHAIYGGISWTEQDITQIWYPPYGYHRARGIIVGGYIWDDAPGLRYGDMTPPERLRAAVAEGERVHPGYGAELEAGVSQAWRETPFQKGGWPKSRHKSPEALQRPDGAVFFAGDQVTALPGWQEGAVLAAHAAVNAIHERVRAK